MNGTVMLLMIILEILSLRLISRGEYTLHIEADLLCSHLQPRLRPPSRLERHLIGTAMLWRHLHHPGL